MGETATPAVGGATMDLTGLATIVKSVSDLLVVGFGYAFGGEAARKQAALEDATRINPWLYPSSVQPAQKDNTLLFVVIILAFLLFGVMVMAALKGEKNN